MSTNEPIRAVLVDDDPGCRLLLQLVLERRNGIEVVGEAGDGLAGAQVVADTSPDVVVLDMLMPLMDGMEALPLMKAVSPDTRIIVWTAAPDPDLRHRAMELGAFSFLPKTVTPAEVVESIEQAMGLVPHEGPIATIARTWPRPAAHRAEPVHRSRECVDGPVARTARRDLVTS